MLMVGLTSEQRASNTTCFPPPLNPNHNPDLQQRHGFSHTAYHLLTMPLSIFFHNSLKKLTAMSLAQLTFPPKSLSSIATTYRWLHSSYPRAYSKIRLRGFAFICSASPSHSSSSVVGRRNRNASSTISLPPFYQQNLGYGRFAYDEYASEEDPEIEYQSSPKQLVSFILI